MALVDLSNLINKKTIIILKERNLSGKWQRSN